jgi:class I lanthipeptide synthase
VAWRAILDGDDARRARDAVAAICERIDALEITDASLASGAAGLAILAGYRAFAGESGAEAQAHACLQRAIELVDAAPTFDPTFGWGIAGVGWAMQHLRALIPVADDALVPIDEMALELVAREGDALPYEHLLGAIGLGVYGLERGREDVVAAVVRRLARTAEPTATGVTWRTQARHGAADAGIDPRGHLDLGIAHGVAGVIAFLATACAAGIEVNAARPLLGDAVAWLLAQEDVGARPRFPMCLGAAPREIRNGWCYGDVGIAAVLVNAGHVAGEPAWIARGREIATGFDRDPIGGGATVAGGFCHGIVGRAHLLARVAAVLDDEVVGRASPLPRDDRRVSRRGDRAGPPGGRSGRRDLAAGGDRGRCARLGSGLATYLPQVVTKSLSPGPGGLVVTMMVFDWTPPTTARSASSVIGRCRVRIVVALSWRGVPAVFFIGIALSSGLLRESGTRTADRHGRDLAAGQPVMSGRRGPIDPATTSYGTRHCRISCSEVSRVRRGRRRIATLPSSAVVIRRVPSGEKATANTIAPCA